MNRRRTILYTDPPWALGPDGHLDPSRATLERTVLGEDHDLRFGPHDGSGYLHQGPELASALRDVDALVIHRLQITDEILDAAGPNLRVVGRQGVGFDNLAPELLARRGIIGFNLPDYCIDEVAAHTLALLLSWERRLIPQHEGLRDGTFNVYAGGVPRRLQDQTAGILGFGRIGRAVAARLQLFYGRILACDPYVSADLMAAHGVQRVSFDELLAGSDALLLHCLLNEETEGIIDRRALARMRPQAVLVNAARGKLIVAEDLCTALQEGRLAGAGLDVFSPEDPHQDPWASRLVQLPNVVVSSHRAYLSIQAEQSQRRRAAEGIRQVLETGQPPAVGHRTAGLQALGADPVNRPQARPAAAGR